MASIASSSRTLLSSSTTTASLRYTLQHTPSADFSTSSQWSTKLKTHKGAAKRWKPVSNGSFKRAQAGKQHLNTSFSPSRINKLAQTIYSSHTQTKILRRLLPYARSLSTQACAPVSDRAVLEVSGKDAGKFLKGMTSKEVDGLGGGYSGFLNGTGRVLYDTFIYPTSTQTPSTTTSTSGTTTNYLIDYPTSSNTESPATPLGSHLKKFILRSKVRLNDVSDNYDVWQVWGDDSSTLATREWKFGNGGSAEPHWDVKVVELGEGEVGAWDLRAGSGGQGMGRRVMVQKGEKPSSTKDHEIASSLDYHLRRMTLGVPEGIQEIVPGSALPLESCMDVMGGIDFRKGCYVGQELTVRTYHVGHTRKRIMPIRFLSSSESSNIPPSKPAKWSDVSSLRPISGSPISFFPPSTAASQRSKPAVKVLSIHPEYAVGLGLMRLELVERCWGLGDWGSEVVAPASEDRGKLEVMQDQENGQSGLQVWAGRGRGWYTVAEEMEGAGPVGH